jgi:hypothetical protein
VSHTPSRPYLDAEDLQELLHLHPHEIRCLLEPEQIEALPEFLPSHCRLRGGYSSFAVLLEAM